MSKKIVLLLIVILLIFGGLFVTKFLQINKAMSSRKAPPPPLVTTVNVVQEKWQQMLPTIGSLNPLSGISVSNEVAGIVSAIHFQSGQAVSKGNLLVELDTSTDQAQLNGLKAAAKLAQLKFNRQASLLKSKATSRSSHDEARAELDLANAAVIAQQSTLDKKRIRAPFDGVIGIRQISPGQYLDKGYQIAPLVSLSPIFADFTLAERYVADIAVNQTIQLQVQAYPDEVFEGRIQAINPNLDTNTRTLSIRALIDNAELKLKAGMFANINILVSQPKTVLTLPDTTITYNTYGENVFIVIDKDDKKVVQHRTIKIGQSRHGRVEIQQGLSLHDTVVNEGHVKLRNGIAISISDTSASPTP
ncbi:MAG: efflux RND transporter periplasmic adaptor subunit [Cycloclasticus sp.]